MADKITGRYRLWQLSIIHEAHVSVFCYHLRTLRAAIDKAGILGKRHFENLSCAQNSSKKTSYFYLIERYSITDTFILSIRNQIDLNNEHNKICLPFAVSLNMSRVVSHFYIHYNSNNINNKNLYTLWSPATCYKSDHIKIVFKSSLL